MKTLNPTNMLTGALLRVMAANFNHRSAVREYMRSNGGWVDFTIGIKTEDGGVEQSITFRDGKASVSGGPVRESRANMVFKDESVVKEMLSAPPNEIMNMLLMNKLRLEGNLSCMNIFNFYLSVLMGRVHSRQMLKQKQQDKEEKREKGVMTDRRTSEELKAKRGVRLEGERVDPGVAFLEDPYLSKYALSDFPRLERFLDIHFTTRPEVCSERPKLLTGWFVRNGFETDASGEPWVPALRQGNAYRHLMENRKPIIRKDDLIAGTTTTKEIGVAVYPDSHGTMIWGELKSVTDRLLNPYDISEATVQDFHREIFPFWVDRSFREWVRSEYGEPLCQRLDERFAVYFMWKTAALSHTIADFPKLFAKGTSGIIDEIRAELETCPESETDRRDELNAMVQCLEGLAAYAKNLSAQAERDAAQEKDPARKEELGRLSEICARVPEGPARTLDEAVNALWIGWVGLHMESTNAGLSLGRLDQWLQPFFVSDMEKLDTPEEREECVKHAIELVGCFYMRCTDHLPLVPDIGNYLFGGSSSDQAITLGGTTPDGGDAVNDMTYVFLKVTELLGIRDPNVNARFNPAVNSDVYLKRLCEVNLITAATPSMHNDLVVMASLAEFDYPSEDLRDWSATGCVEPTLSGKHMGHTNCMMMNMVAALEMAMNDGRHPLMDWEVGPKTGRVEDMATFEDFFSAFTTQFKFLIDQSVEYNNLLGEAHSVIRPTPLLSSLIDGCISKGKDATKGGAKHNTSGSACIGLADVTDSLLVIKKLVYDDEAVTFAELKHAVDDNFEGAAALRATVTKKVPLFGSGSAEAVEMADRVTRFAHDAYGDHLNFRGGRYTAGFWSMSNHVAFGTLTGALPSGRLAGKPFTPGLTPEPNASRSLLDNIRDVAALDPRNMNNNIAFNVKVVPATADSHERVVENMFSYVKTYFELGGMQMQMNVVTSDMLRDAMAHPENYRNLLVRISGYNAYFVTLNRDMQLELIERAEYGI